MTFTSSQPGIRFPLDRVGAYLPSGPKGAPQDGTGGEIVCMILAVPGVTSVGVNEHELILAGVILLGQDTQVRGQNWKVEYERELKCVW